MEQTTIKSLAEELGVPPMVIKTSLGLAPTTPGATELTDDQADSLRANADDYAGQPEVEAPVKKAKEKKDDPIVVFYWPRGENYQFFVMTEGADTPNKFYKTEKSVLRLDKTSAFDAKAIAFLDAHKGNKANGGKLFSRNNSVQSQSKGETIDELMALNEDTLAQMAGLGRDGARLSKGTLIAKIIESRSE